MSTTPPGRATYPAPTSTEVEDVGRVVLAGSWLENLLAALLAAVRADADGTLRSEDDFASIVGSNRLVSKLRDAIPDHHDVEVLTGIVTKAEAALADRHSYAHGSFATTQDGRRMLYRGNPSLAKKLGFDSNGVMYPYSREDARDTVAGMMEIADEIIDYLGLKPTEG